VIPLEVLMPIVTLTGLTPARDRRAMMEPQRPRSEDLPDLETNHGAQAPWLGLTLDDVKLHDTHVPLL